MSQSLFRGSGVALVTPMTPDGIDFPALEQLIEWHIASGTDALVLCATTGEGATLTYAERAEIIERSVRQVNGRVPVIVGTGGVLVVTPYYNKATQRGLVRHFTAVADAVDRPLIVYNVPSRTGVSCTAETYAVLAQHPNIIGVKEASGSFALIQETLNLCGDGFSVWSGNDEDTAAVCALGGAANIVPREMHRLVELCLADRILEAGREQLRLAPLIRALFCEVNPIPVKTAMARMGLCSDLLRLPLCEMSEENRARLFAAMDACGIDA